MQRIEMISQINYSRTKFVSGNLARNSAIVYFCCNNLVSELE